MIDRTPTDHPEVDPPDALAVQTTPKANIDRYDRLRQAGEKRVTLEVCRSMKRGVMTQPEPPS